MGPPLRPLLSVLTRTERAILAAAAVAQFVERVAVVAATAFVALRGARSAPVVAVALGAAFLVRSALTSQLRISARSRLLSSLSAALLTDATDVATATTEELELSITEGLYASEDIVAARVPQLAGDAAASMVLAIAIAFYLPARLVLEGGLAMAVGAGVALVARRLTAGSSERSWRALAPAFEDFAAVLHGRVEILTNGNAPRFLASLARKLDVWRAEAGSAGRTSFLAGRAPVAGAAVVVGLVLLVNGGESVATLAQAAILASATPAFVGLARELLELTRGLVRARAAIDCLARARPEEAGKGVRLDSITHVNWRNVSLRYPGSTEPALAEASVTWNLGEFLGLAGQNGSGKSTFVRLLLGLHEPTEGTVEVDGVPLESLERSSLRERIAYLVQRPYLPDRATIADAIRLVTPLASTAATQCTLKRLQLWPTLLRHHPSAPLEVKIGTLSAGEKQRVAIARVLLRDAPVLLLDEPDANLDAEGVALVGEILRDESKTRMVLVVAHSPALLASTDRVLHFESGHVRDRTPEKHEG